MESKPATTQEIISDICEIYTRLFDHRPVLNAEVKYYVKEFEEKGGGDQDVERMFKTLERVTELGDAGVDALSADVNTNMSALNQRLRAVTQQCNKLLAMQDRDTSQKLVEGRDARALQWNAFIQMMCEKSGDVDKHYVEQCEKLREEHEKRMEEFSKPSL